MAWNDGLEGDALKIASSDAPQLHVVAGPGTGKTFALMRRVARLLEEGTPPGDIFVCTFTRTAARDLRRALDELGVTGADEVAAMTLHSYCLGLLQKQDVLTATGRTPRVLMDFEKSFMLRDLADGQTVTQCKERLEAFSAGWARLQNEEPGWAQDPVDAAFEASMGAWLRTHRAMLLEELVPLSHRYLRDNPVPRAQLAYPHVLVDEYQDLNRAEQITLELLAGDKGFVVVGDEDQSIYGFKCAHPEGIVEFPEAHPECEESSLDFCRRCPQLVVRLANSLIKHNPDRADRELAPKPENPEGTVRVVQWNDPSAEFSGLADYITKVVQPGSGVAKGDVLLLCPNRTWGYAIRDELLARNIEAASFFGEQGLEGDVTDADGCRAPRAMTLLTLAATPDDAVAWRCWCGFGSPSLRAGAWDRLTKWADVEGLSVVQALKRLSEMEESPFAHSADLKACYLDAQERLAALAPLKGLDILDALAPAGTGWADGLRLLAGEVDPEWGPADLRNRMIASATQPEVPTNPDFVRVMSLHKSKGLTAKVVVVAGLLDGFVPTSRVFNEKVPAPERERILRESRRLFYVAVTRATDTLVLSSCALIEAKVAYGMGLSVGKVFKDNQGNLIANTRASQFVGELGPELPPAISGSDME